MSLPTPTDLRDALTRLHPARWRGEETGAGGPDHPTDCWLVDPHDGTRAFLRGQRLLAQVHHVADAGELPPLLLDEGPRPRAARR